MKGAAAALVCRGHGHGPGGLGCILHREATGSWCCAWRGSTGLAPRGSLEEEWAGIAGRGCRQGERAEPVGTRTCLEFGELCACQGSPRATLGREGPTWVPETALHVNAASTNSPLGCPGARPCAPGAWPSSGSCHAHVHPSASPPRRAGFHPSPLPACVWCAVPRQRLRLGFEVEIKR